MAEYKPPKRRGKQTSRLVVDFGKPIPSILLKPEAWPYLPGPTILDPDRKPTTEELRKFHAASFPMFYQRMFAAWELFELKGPDFEDPFGLAHKIFSKIFPGYAIKDPKDLPTKPSRWTWMDPDTMTAYGHMLELRANGVSKRSAWKKGVEEVFGSRYAESTYQRRWESFSQEPVIRMIETIAARSNQGLGNAQELVEQFVSGLKRASSAK